MALSDRRGSGVGSAWERRRNWHAALTVNPGCALVDHDAVVVSGQSLQVCFIAIQKSGQLRLCVVRAFQFIEAHGKAKPHTHHRNDFLTDYSALAANFYDGVDIG